MTSRSSEPIAGPGTLPTMNCPGLRNPPAWRRPARFVPRRAGLAFEDYTEIEGRVLPARLLWRSRKENGAFEFQQWVESGHSLKPPE